MEPSLVIKVQYGETLRRFSSCVVDGKLDLDMIALRKKVFSLFSFPAGSEVDLAYIDEDGDVVKLVDEEDLHDIMRQRLNHLRITVRSNAEKSVGLRPHGRSSESSTPVKSPPMQLPLQVGNTTVSEVLNTLPNNVRDTVSKFSTELGLDTSSPAGYLVILDSLAKMGLTYLKDVSAAGAKGGPSESSTDALVTKDKDSSTSVGTTQVSELKSLATDQGNTGGVIPAVDNANAKDKSSILAKNTAPNSFNDSKMQNDIGSRGNKVGKNGRSGPKMKSVQKLCESHPGWNLMGPKPLTRIDSPFSVRPVPPYMQRQQLPDRVPPVKSSYNYSDVMGSVLHAGIQCDGCGVHPITGPRFKSKIKEDYDLCNSCFDNIGSEAEYIRMDLPMNYRSSDPFNFHYPRCLGRSSTLPADSAKLDSCFILDVNILDGTIMTPLTHFTKIWRMRNNGAVAWPHGTNLIWIGGDQLSKTLSCGLKLPAKGCPVDMEIDIAVNFTAPENSGRYVSYWRMASPSGHQFGQRVWVLIQVDSPLMGSNSKNHHDFNLNFPPVTSGINSLQNVNASIDSKMMSLQNVNASTESKMMGLQNVNASTESKMMGLQKEHASIDSKMMGLQKENASIESKMMGLQKENASTESKMMGLQKGNASIESKMMGLQEGNASMKSKMMGLKNVKASIDYKTRDDFVKIDTPTGDQGIYHQDNETLLVGAGAKPDSAKPEASSPVRDPAVDQSKVELISISVPQNSDMDDPSVMMEVKNGTNEVEQTLLKELEYMGFTQVDLNKEILRKNEYDLEEALNELCDTEWDPMLAELQEMGFSNNEVNKKLLKKNNGSIKRVVMDLIAGEDDE